MTRTSIDKVWEAVRDVGALHTRLVPGFVIDTRIDGAARVVTFANGRVVREPIVTIDDEANRLVWTSEGGMATHYNGALQVTANTDGTSTVVWIADFLPDDIRPAVAGAVDAGLRVMKKTLDAIP